MKRALLIKTIAQGLPAAPPQRAYILGINGVDTAGKSSFALALARELRACGHSVCCVHLDDFHNPSAVRHQGHDPLKSYLEHAFDLQKLEREILAPARAGHTIDIDLKLLDLKDDCYTLTRHYSSAPGSIILIEGVLLYRPPLDAYFDYRIFLDIPFDEVLRRAAARDVPLYGRAFLQQYHDKYIPIQRRYLAEQHPRSRSDLVIDNRNWEMPQIIAKR